jgi:hypothetical protein
MAITNNLLLFVLLNSEENGFFFRWFVNLSGLCVLELDPL